MSRSNLLAREVFWSITSRPGRSILFVGLVAAGICALLLTLSVSDYFEKRLQQEAFGPFAHSVVVSENALLDDRYGTPLLTDLSLRLGKGAPIISSAAWRAGQALMITPDGYETVDTYGVFGKYQVETGTEIAEGRFLTDREISRADRKCLLGYGTAQRLGRQRHKKLVLNGIQCDIVGVLAKPASRTQEKFARSVIFPFEASGRYFLDNEALGPNEVSWITYEFKDGTDIPRQEIRIDTALRKAHGIPQSQPPPFQYGNAAASLESLTRQQSLTSGLAWLLGIISLSIGATGAAIISINIASQRKQEFAIKRVIGASVHFVILELLLQTVCLGLAASLLAIAMAQTLTLVLNGPLDWNVTISPDIAILGTTVSLATSIVCAIMSIAFILRDKPIATINS